MSLIPATYQVYDANGAKQTFTAVQDSVTQQITPKSVSLPQQLQPAAGAAHTVSTGGTAVNAIVATQAGINGGLIINPHGAGESLFVDFVNVAGVAAPGVNGTTIELQAGERLDLPAGLVNAVSCNAVTSAHAFTALVW